VLKFAADDFWKASQTLAEWSADCISHNPSKRRVKAIGDSFGKFVQQVRGLCLPVTLKELEKFHTWTEIAYSEIDSSAEVDGQVAAHANFNAEFGRRLKVISSVLHSEIQSYTFFHMPQDRARYYDQRGLFGAEVIAKFPRVQFDVTEAGNCYSLGRGTACVFHLMRIMEVGVQEFGTRLGVQLTNEKNWQKILDEANRTIKMLPAKGSATVALCQVSANLYSVKLAWRNDVMHPNDTYTLEEAENLIQQVKLFMGQLAKIV
jgi:hypothetical protein